MEPAADTDRSRHVLVILLPNSPRALWGCYGSFANLTPHLDELAARGSRSIAVSLLRPNMAIQVVPTGLKS